MYSTANSPAWVSRVRRIVYSLYWLWHYCGIRSTSDREILDEHRLSAGVMGHGAWTAEHAFAVRARHVLLDLGGAH